MINWIPLQERDPLYTRRASPPLEGDTDPSPRSLMLRISQLHSDGEQKPKGHVTPATAPCSK